MSYVYAATDDDLEIIRSVSERVKVSSQDPGYDLAAIERDASDRKYLIEAGIPLLLGRVQVAEHPEV